MDLIKLKGSEQIRGTSSSLQDFWAWAYSDVLSNRNRAVFAEFLVANALGLTKQPRIEWDAVDLHYQRKTIEVKTSAYVQSWTQDKPSQIRFDIAEKYGWDAASDTQMSAKSRSADCYTFCVYEGENAQDVMNVQKWSFWVLHTSIINETLGSQKSIGLNRLMGLTDAIKYDALHGKIHQTLDLASTA